MRARQVGRSSAVGEQDPHGGIVAEPYMSRFVDNQIVPAGSCTIPALRRSIVLAAWISLCLLGLA
ncbi:MAG: hypothetical protein J0H99_13730, partial [Rhodospirillales bacterium]|nr:hypothetical protein [Rhodospirillales bacterium]